MSARRQVEQALRFISENLERPIALAELARAANLSAFHFHRVFHAETGESPGRFLTRRRLELAALRLAYEPERSVTDIALSSGYSSSSNFTKAFTGYFGCSPSEARTPSRQPVVGKLANRYGKNFDPRTLYSLPPERSNEERAEEAAAWNRVVRFENADAKPFAALSCDDGYDLDAVTSTWTQLLTRTQQLGLWREDADAWGVPRDSPFITAAPLIRYDACVPCSVEAKVPEPLFRTSMSAGRYAVFDWEGAVTDIADVYRSIYSSWFAESSVAPDNYEPFDHYVDGFPRDGRVHLELWFRVRPRE